MFQVLIQTRRFPNWSVVAITTDTQVKAKRRAVKLKRLRNDVTDYKIVVVDAPPPASVSSEEMIRRVAANYGRDIT